VLCVLGNPPWVSSAQAPPEPWLDSLLQDFRRDAGDPATQATCQAIFAANIFAPRRPRRPAQATCQAIFAANIFAPRRPGDLPGDLPGHFRRRPGDLPGHFRGQHFRSQATCQAIFAANIFAPITQLSTRLADTFGMSTLPRSKRRSRPLRVESNDHLWFVTTRTIDALFWLHPMLTSGMRPPNRKARRVLEAMEDRFDKRLAKLVERANERLGPYQAPLTVESAKRLMKGAVGSALARAQERFGVVIYALVVMSNHLHMVLCAYRPS
jgi:hypothetical protein